MSAPELVDRRVLGAVRFRSWASGLPVEGPLQVMASPQPGAVAVTVIANRSGLHVIQAATGFEAYTATFDEGELAAVAPGPSALHLRVIDPADRFLPRDFDFAAPRALTGTEAVGRPVEVWLYPTVTGALADGWAVARVRVERELAGTGDPAPRREPVPGALVCVLRGPDDPDAAGGADAVERVVIGRGVTEWRRGPRGPRASVGEALVPVRGIPLLQWSQAPVGDVLKPGQNVFFEVTFDTGFTAGGPGHTPPPTRAPIPDLSALETVERPPPAEGAIRSLRVADSFTLRARGAQELTFVVNHDRSSVRRL